MSERNEAIDQLRKKLEGLKVAMMTTVDVDGRLRSRPMAAQELDDDGNLWFFTHATSTKADEVLRDQHVNLSYASMDDNRYVSVSGRADIVRNRAKVEELWSDVYKAWFPEGLDDPNLALMRVRVEKAEYWDSPSAPVAHLVGFIKTIATGKTYQPGESEKLEVQRS